jgi:hypothetical protein
LYYPYIFSLILSYLKALRAKFSIFLLVAQLLPSTSRSLYISAAHQCRKAMCKHVLNHSERACYTSSVHGQAKRASSRQETSEAGNGHEEEDSMGYVLMIAFSMVLWLASTTDAAAASYYASPSGSGSTCSNGSPCSVNTALGKTGPGDTIYLKGGTYASGAFGSDSGSPSNLASGTSGSRITYRPAPGEFPIVQMFNLEGKNYIDIQGEHRLVIDGQNAVYSSIFMASTGLRVYDLELKNGRDQGIFGDCNTCEFINLEVHHNGNVNGFGEGLCHGIYTKGPNLLIDGGRWHDHYNGYAIHLYDAPQNITVRNVQIYDNIAYKYGGGMFSYGNTKVYNNLFYNNTLGSWHPSGNGEYYSNTFYALPQFGLTISGGTVRNNIFYQASLDTSGTTTSNNLVGTNPQFVNAGTGDFHLQAGSPAIDAGMTVSGVTTDFDKRPRPQGARFDIGAYEYTGSAPRPLSTPTNFRVAGQ